MNSYSMSVDGVGDTDTPHPHTEPEDVQTSHDAGLFDDEDDREGGARNSVDALSQPSASVVRLDKRIRNEMTSEKCRFKEVDYSQTLRSTVYEQEEHINKMIREAELTRQQAQEHIQEQYRQAEEERERHMRDVSEKTQQWEEALREREKQLSHFQREHEKIRMQQQQQQEWQQAELERREAELSARKNQELEEREKAIFAEMERRLQLEVEKLKAEKEGELINMEQRFARRRRQQDVATEMDEDSAPRSTQQQARTPQKPQSNTPCLEAIKRIKKARGTTHRIRLVSMVDDDEPSESHPERSPTVEQEPPPDDASPASMMENAVSRGVEAALRRIFDKDPPTVTKRYSPRRKKMQDDEVRKERVAELSHARDFLLGEVRHLLRDTLDISQDADFIVHQPANRDDVYSYEHEDGPGPDTQNLAFDLENGSQTPWNARILDMLLGELQKRSMEEQWPFRRSDGYYREILEDRYKRLRTIWRAARPKVTAKGILETAAEVEERLITKRDENLRSVRQATRRRNKYIRRTKVLHHLVELNKDENKEDLPAWQWLQKLIKTLGDGGMSSEESDVENDVECVLRVKNMVWRRGIERELHIIDHQGMLEDNIFAPQGSKPMKRIRAPGNPTTSRSPITGLPEGLYNGEWLASLTERQVERLNISDETFRWMKVVVV